jgi:MFS family permease
MKDFDNFNNKKNETEAHELFDNEVNFEDNEKYSEKSNSNLIDLIMNKAGYNFQTIKVIILVATILSVEGLHMTLFSSILIPFTNLLKISENEIKFVSSILFVGVGAGSLISGSTTIKYGRPFIINSFLFLIFFSNLILGFVENIMLFAAFRFLIGFSLGLIVPMSINLLTEYLPIKLRSFILTGVWAGFGIGAIYLLMIMLVLMPNLETAMVQKTIMIASILPLISFLLCLFFLEDSPRNLILRNNNKDSIKLLERMTSININEHMQARIFFEVREGTNKDLSNQISEIFNKKFWVLSLLLSYIWFLNSLVTYGPFLVSTLTMKSIGKSENGINSNTQVIINQIIINIICMPSNLLGGVLSEISYLGRNKSTILNFLFSLFFLILLIYIPEQFAIYFGLFQAFVGISFNINTSYSCEVYPTRIRDQAIGFLFFCTRLGGFLSQIIYLYMNKIGLWWPYYFTVSFIVTNSILIYLLPFETYGQPLDFDYHIEEHRKGDKEEVKTLNNKL